MGMCAVAGKKTMRHYADGGEIDPEMQTRIEANKAKHNPPQKQGLFSGLFGGSAPKPQAAPPVQQAQPTGMAAAIRNREELKKAANYANGGVVKPTIVVPDGVDMNAYTQEQGSGRGVVDAAGRVVDSLPYAAAQFVPGLNVPLGLAAAAVHAAQGRIEELPIDAASTLGGKGAGVLLQKGRQLQNAIAKQAIAGGVGRTANTVQALGAADAFGAPAYANGGKIKGPGTPTSDSIPAKVKQTGEPIKVSTEERILSKKQDIAVQGIARGMGFKGTDEMLEQLTGEPVGPTMKGGKAAARNGALINDNDLNPEQTAAMANQQAGFVTQNATDIAGKGLLARAFSNPNDLTPDQTAASGAMRSGFVTENAGARIGTPPVAYGYTPPETKTSYGDDPAGTVGTPGFSAGPKVGDTVIDLTANPANGATNMAKAGGGGMGGSAPQVIRQGNSFSGTGPGIKEDMSKPLTRIDMKANNEGMAKANAIRGSTGVNQSDGPSVMTLGDSGRVAGDALLDKWGRQTDAKSAMQMAAANPRAAQAIASTYGSSVQGETALARDATDQMRNETNNATLRRGQDVGLQSDQGRQSVAMRGQDIGLLSDQAKIAGNPVANDLTRAQTGLAQAGIDEKKRSQAMIDELNNPATDPKRRDLLLQSIGKGATYRHATGGTSIDPATGMAIKSPDVIYNDQTGQPREAGQQAAPKIDVKIGSPVNAPDGTHTFQGKTIIVKGGKVTGVS